jgi:hypothetical protein
MGRGALEALAMSLEPYLNPLSKETACPVSAPPPPRPDEHDTPRPNVECRSAHTFLGPEGMQRGQRWPAMDALDAEETILRDDPRIVAAAVTTRAECGSTPQTQGLVWTGDTCRKPLVDLQSIWIPVINATLNETVSETLGEFFGNNVTDDAARATFLNEMIRGTLPG